MPSVAVNPNTSDAFLRATSAASLAAVRGAATGTVTSAGGNDLHSYLDNTSGAFYCDRSLMCFDTSAIPDDATVTGGTLTLRVTAATGPGGGDIYLDLVTASPADPTSLASGDFDSFGTTKLASTINVYGSYPLTATFTLNAAGIAAINKSGYTNLFVVMANDFENSASSPSDLVSFLSPTRYYTDVTFNSGDAASNKPLLTVNYTASTPAQISGSSSAAATGSLSLSVPTPATLPLSASTPTASGSLALSAPALVTFTASSATASGSLDLTTTNATGSRAAPGWLGLFITDTTGSSVPLIAGGSNALATGSLSLQVPARAQISGSGTATASGTLSLRSSTETRIATPTSLGSTQFQNSTLGSVQFGNSRVEPAVDHPVS